MKSELKFPKSVTASLVFVLATLVFFTSKVSSVFAQDVLLQEDFEDGNANDGTPVDWDENAGSGYWIVENGKYKGSVFPGGIQPITLAGDPSWHNYALEVSVTGLEGVDRHILFRFTQFHTRGYSIKYREANNGFPGHIELQKHGQNVVLATNNNFKSHIGETHRFRIESLENRIKVFADGNLVIDYTDNNNPILDGRIGFLIEPSGIGLPTTTLYDNIVVENLDPNSGFTLPITDLKQYDSLWGNNIYDHAYLWASNPTISRWGCALTSAVMVLKYFNFPIDPNTLNTWLNGEIDGYLRNGLINWLAISRYTHLNRNASNESLEFQSYHTDDALIKSELGQLRPVIVKIPGHFVVVKGKTSNNFIINDPASTTTLLSEIENSLGSSYTTIYSYKPSQTDLSYIMLVLNQGFDIKLYNNDGNLLASNNFTEEPLLDESDISANSGDSLTVLTYSKPENGEYYATLEGNGSYQLDSYLYDKQGNVIKNSFVGTIVESSKDFHITIGSQNKISETQPTFESIINDLDEAYKSGYFKNYGVYQSIKSFLNLTYHLNNKGKNVSQLLQGLIRYINSHSPKLIDPEIGQSFENKINLLIKSIKQTF